MYRCPLCLKNMPGPTCTCGYEYKTIGSIKDFSSQKLYWNQVPQDVMNKALESADDTRTIAKKLFGSDSYMYRYIFEENRACWKKLFDLQNSTVLDIGCGWGALPIELSKSAKKVIACDSTLETLKFVEKRLAENERTNVELVCINSLSALAIPVADNSADLIILNGVLEWVAKGTNKNPTALQIGVLKEIYRILKPEGILVTAIENRIGFVYFCGHPDEHTFTNMTDIRLKYTTVLPRFLSNIIMKKKNNMPYDTYTYSYKGYKEIFKKAGFGFNHTLTLMPDYRFPAYYFPIEGSFFDKYKSQIELLLQMYHKKKMEDFSKENNSSIVKFIAKTLFSFLTKLHKHRYLSHYFLFISSKKEIESTLNYEDCYSLFDNLAKE